MFYRIMKKWMTEPTYYAELKDMLFLVICQQKSKIKLKVV